MCECILVQHLHENVKCKHLTCRLDFEIGFSASRVVFLTGDDVAASIRGRAGHSRGGSDRPYHGPFAQHQGEPRENC